jgi:hypothetical protein
MRVTVLLILCFGIAVAVFKFFGLAAAFISIIIMALVMPKNKVASKVEEVGSTMEDRSRKPGYSLEYGFEFGHADDHTEHLFDKENEQL